LEIVAHTGGQAPGLPEGTTFSFLYNSRPTINDGGVTAFTGYVSGPSVSPGTDTAVWRGLPNELELVARDGDPAPGGPPQSYFRYIGNFAAILNNAEDVA